MLASDECAWAMAAFRISAAFTRKILRHGDDSGEAAGLAVPCCCVVNASFLKKVYDRVMVFTSSGRFGSTMKRTGMSRTSPALRVWAVKQKHSVLLKNPDARAGATEGTALPTMVRSEVLRA